MIGDVIDLQEKYLDTADALYDIVKKELNFASKLVIGICGESGSGKSITAFALQKIMGNNGVKSVVIQMDDYFKLPPKDNHENRIKSLSNVGMNEVRLNAMLENINQFKAGKAFIEKPLINYQGNSISEEMVKTDDIQVLIIEGTYIFDLDGLDFRIFIDRNYKDTYENRMNRNRDQQTDFIEEVLKIEHHIIRQFKERATLVLDKNYQIIMP